MSLTETKRCTKQIVVNGTFGKTDSHPDVKVDDNKITNKKDKSCHKIMKKD